MLIEERMPLKQMLMMMIKVARISAIVFIKIMIVLIMMTPIRGQDISLPSKFFFFFTFYFYLEHWGHSSILSLEGRMCLFGVVL